MPEFDTGVPHIARIDAAENTHEAAEQVAPGCRVVYADNDPIVLSRKP